MATLSSRLIISLVDQVSGPARGVKSALDGLVRSARSQPFKAMATEARTVYRETRGAATAAGFAIAGMIQQTREFNEAEFGYQFARIPDHFKGVTLDMQGVQAEAAAVAEKSRKVARQFGLIPSEVQKARTEVEKIGIGGKTGESLWLAALGLNMSDSKMPTDVAAKFLGSMYKGFSDQRKKLADKMGVDLKDEKQAAWFENWWIKSMSAKSAFAAAKSALDPGDIVHGARQYAPAWASLGMSPEEVLGAIAHGSNFGFMAPELGTALKSWGNRLVKPTAGGMRWLNNLKMDPSKWVDGFGAADPAKATTALNSLLGNQLYTGKRGGAFKGQVRGLLDAAQRSGKTASPEFQGELAAKIQDKLGPGWAGKTDEIAEAVRFATLSATGNVNVMDFIREGLAKGMPKAAMLEVLEGRHVARNDPFFRFFDQFVEMVAGLQKIDAMHLDGTMEARKQSSAGKTTALAGAWEDLMITFEKSGVIATIKDALLGLSAALQSIPTDVVRKLTWGIVGLAAVGAGGIIAAGVVSGITAIGAAARLALIPLLALSTRLWSLGAASAATQAAAVAPALFGMGAGKAGGRASKDASKRMIAGMAPFGVQGLYRNPHLPASATVNSAASQKMLAGMSAFGAVPPGIGARLASLASGLGRIAAFAGRLTLVSGAITLLVAAVQNAGGIGEMFSSIGSSFAASLGPQTVQMLTDIASGFSGLVDWFGKITGLLDVSTGRWQSWGETIGSALAGGLEKIATLYGYLKDIYGWLRDSRVGNFLLGERQPETPSPGAAAAKLGPDLTATKGAATATPQPGAGSLAPAAPATSSAELSGASSQAQTTVVTVRSAMDQVRGIVSQTVGEMQSLGQQAAENFAAGIRNGTPAIKDAASSAMGAASRGALRGSFTDGGR